MSKSVTIERIVGKKKLTFQSKTPNSIFYLKFWSNDADKLIASHKALLKKQAV